MPEVRFASVPHYDWSIEVIQFNNRFCFCCYHPNLENYHNDGFSYPTYRLALAAGRRFIDRELAVIALVGVLEEFVGENKISIEDFWNLTNFQP